MIINTFIVCIGAEDAGITLEVINNRKEFTHSLFIET